MTESKLKYSTAKEKATEQSQNTSERLETRAPFFEKYVVVQTKAWVNTKHIPHTVGFSRKKKVVAKESGSKMK